MSPGTCMDVELKQGSSLEFHHLASDSHCSILSELLLNLHGSPFMLCNRLVMVKYKIQEPLTSRVAGWWTLRASKLVKSTQFLRYVHSNVQLTILIIQTNLGWSRWFLNLMLKTKPWLPNWKTKEPLTHTTNCSRVVWVNSTYFFRVVYCHQYKQNTIEYNTWHCTCGK